MVVTTCEAVGEEEDGVHSSKSSVVVRILYFSRANHRTYSLLLVHVHSSTSPLSYYAYASNALHGSILPLYSVLAFLRVMDGRMFVKRRECPAWDEFLNTLGEVWHRFSSLVKFGLPLLFAFSIFYLFRRSPKVRCMLCNLLPCSLLMSPFVHSQIAEHGRREWIAPQWCHINFSSHGDFRRGLDFRPLPTSSGSPSQDLTFLLAPNSQQDST